MPQNVHLLIKLSNQMLSLPHYYMHSNKEEVKVAQLCPTLCNPMDCIFHGILQARIMEWVAPGDIPKPGIKPRSPVLQADSLPAEPQGKSSNRENYQVKKKNVHLQKPQQINYNY